MYRTFSVLVLLGFIVWGFLMLERFGEGSRAREFAERADDANTSERCAEYRTTDGEDEETWSLGYVGRVRQLAHGCF